MEKITIKEIARKAGVSIGTVDRVLHNRGEVAEKTRKLVLKIAEEGNYTTNIYARNLKLNKTFRLAIIIPEDNEYWRTHRQGMEAATKNQLSPGLNLHFYTFDRSNPDSFLIQAKKGLEFDPDGVIIAPLLGEVASSICNALHEKNVPYVFVDSNLKSANPLAFIGQDTIQSGYLAAKLLNFGFAKGHRAIIARDSGFDSLNKTISERIDGFRNFYLERQWDINLIEELDIINGPYIDLFFNSYENPWHIFVPNSRAHQVVNRIHEFFSKSSTRIIGYDKISKNISAMNTGQIDFIINQNPFQQGYLSIQAFYKHLILNTKVETMQFMPLEIVTKENLDFPNLTY